MREVYPKDLTPYIVRLMHQPGDRFSMAISGNGRLLGMFVTEGMKRFPNATMYDRTEQFRNFAEQEVKLGKTEFAAPEFRKSALVTERNLRSPAAVDVTVVFRSLGTHETVTIAGKVTRNTSSFDFGSAGNMQDVEGFVQKLLQSVTIAR